MKKRAILVFLIITAMLVSNIIYADEGNKLDIEKAAGSIVKNSAAIKATDDALNNAAISLNNAKKSPFSYYANSSYSSLISGEYQLNAGLRDRAVLENTLRLDAYNKYLNVLKAKYTIDVQKEVFEQASQAYKNTQLKAKLNQVSKVELESSEAQYIMEELQLKIYERDLVTLITSLNALMGKAPTTEYTDLNEDNIIPQAEISTYEEYVSSALNNRAEILNLREQLDAKTKEKDLYTDPNSKEYNSYYIQLQYDIDLLNSKLETSAIDIQLELIVTYDQLTNSMAVLDDNQKTLLEAEKNLKTAELKFKMGRISLYDKEQEELAYLNSKYAFRKAQLDAWLAQVQMSFAANLGLKNGKEI
jgi:outer membrane protein TolC